MQRNCLRGGVWRCVVLCGESSIFIFSVFKKVYGVVIKKGNCIVSLPLSLSFFFLLFPFSLSPFSLSPLSFSAFPFSLSPFSLSPSSLSLFPWFLFNNLYSVFSIFPLSLYIPSLFSLFIYIYIYILPLSLYIPSLLSLFLSLYSCHCDSTGG